MSFIYSNKMKSGIFRVQSVPDVEVKKSGSIAFVYEVSTSNCVDVVTKLIQFTLRLRSG